jgi:excisionase family DNA binding protein
MADIAELIRRPPTREESASADEAAKALTRARKANDTLLLVPPHGAGLPLAPAVSDLIVELLRHIAKGEMVMMVAMGALLTTQEAADLLNVSRPFLSGLLKKGDIPFVFVGSHRRVRFDDLKAYKARRDARREAALDELARMGQEFDAS